MKIPDSWKKESTHVTHTMNTLSLTGISLLWGVMLNLISPWWLIVSVFSILAGYGSEVRKRDNG